MKAGVERVGVRIGVGRVVIIQSTKLLHLYVEVRTASTHRDKRTRRLWGDIGIILVHPHNTTSKESEAQERERNCPRSYS